MASHESAPSAIETSTSWPSPERSRSRRAARIPKAAISAPPPRSAICPAGWIGGPPPPPVHHTRPERLEQDVGLAREPEEHAAAALLLQVQPDRALVAVEREEERRGGGL